MRGARARPSERPPDSSRKPSNATAACGSAPIPTSRSTNRSIADKVQTLDVNGNAEDPTFTCGPAGVPRIGFPNKIVMNPAEVVFLHDNENTFRWIPINKPHNTDRDPTYKGDSVAKWEGDTLVIDTTN